jgi:hypothetical protein
VIDGARRGLARDASAGRQRRLLARTFFQRLFESDLMPSAFPQERLVISGIAGIAIPLTVLPVSMRLSGPLLIFFQYSFSMVALAFVALLIWEGIFPDRRDARILSALPIRTRTFVLARLGALTAMFGLFAAGSSALPSLGYAVFGNPLVHFVCFLGIGASAFFAIIGVQCVLLNVVGRAAAQRLAIALQVALVVVVLQAPSIAPPPEFLFGGGDIGSGPASWMPSIWFLSLHEVIAGRREAHLVALALRGAAVAIGMPLLTTILYAATYQRLVRRAIEGEIAPARSRSLLTVLRAAGGRLLTIAVPNAISRAVCRFTLQTLARSRRHKMLLAMYLGVALAVVLSAVIPRAFRYGIEGFARPDPSLLGLPLVLMFFGLIGFRVLINIPLEIKSNWVFRLHESSDRAAAASGVASAMTLAIVLPIALLAFASASMLWGTAVGVRHAAFCAALGLLLLSALLVRLRKIPFTCTYFPGGSRVRFLWPLYLLGFSTYVWTMGRLQRDMLRWGGGFPRAIAIVLLLTAILIVVRRSYLRGVTGLLYEGEDPDQVAFQGFNLSEGMAANAGGVPDLKVRPTYAGMPDLKVRPTRRPGL